jgi:hypothetical protein
MLTLALPLVVAAAALSGEARSFWTVVQGPQLQPAQVQVRARLVGEGRTLAVFQEEGYRFSTLGEADETAQIAAAVSTFDDVIYPREVALFGPCPDNIGNGKVILLLTRNAAPTGTFFPFDERREEEALRFGFHSNGGEILYHTFEQQGNRESWNLQGLAETFHRLLHYARDPGETAWSVMLGDYMPFMCNLASARVLWGDFDPMGTSHSASEPWQGRGWSLLFIQYLRDKLGADSLRNLVAHPENGLSGVAQLLAESGDRRTAADFLADFAMACWLDDAKVGDGRFAFSSVVPPRPLPAARVVASRPTSGVVDVGVGGMAFLVVDGGDERPFPLALQGDPSTRWAGRAVVLKERGPDREIPVEFDAGGAAHVELPALRAGDRMVVAVVAVPGDYPMFDRRTLLLRWGIGWVPHVPADQGRGMLNSLVRKALPDAGAAARTRLMATVERLGGLGSEAPVVATRYAWAPGADAVVQVLDQEAGRRGLPVRHETFVRRASNGTEQEWSNVVVELPGSDARRWPVVLAAHWDGARGDLADSYLRALNLNDNAAGVAVVLEAAGAISRMPHRAPVIVAFLAGGYQDAAGARALLERLDGKLTAWVEVDGIGIPERWPWSLDVHLQGSGNLVKFPWSVNQNFRRVGLVAKTQSEIVASHTGGSVAAARRVPTLIVRTRVGVEGEDLNLPSAIEREKLSPDLMVLLTKVLATTAVNLAGAP